MRQRLGQHFLTNRSVLRVIANALSPRRGEPIIEVGPGHGELTHVLLEQGSSVIAIERDVNLVRHLRDRFKDGNLTIIEGDVLKILPEILKSYKLKAKRYSIVGNIPYYITGHLLRLLGELEQMSRTIVLMVQKEVAQRVCAGSSAMTRSIRSGPSRAGRGMNLLAASVQFWADVKYIKTVSKRVFSPPPKVDSAIIRLTPYTRIIAELTQNYADLRTKYYRAVRAVFRQPRKTILNNLTGADLRGRYADLRGRKENIMERLQKVGINPNDRPQNLSVEQIQALSTLF